MTVMRFDFFTLPLVLLAFAALIAPIRANAAPIHIAIVGDSTVANYKAGDPHRGWGQLLPEFFDVKAVKIDNLAANGRSTKTFKSEGRWDKTLALKPDYIYIQFGHNDSHAKDKPEATDAKTDFSQNLREYIDTARADGAIPILVTPMHRGTKTQDGHFSQELLPYADAMRQVAAENHVPLIDLYTLSEQAFAAMSDDELKSIFALPTDRTHFNEKGARILARIVATKTARLVPALKPDVILPKEAQ